MIKVLYDGKCGLCNREIDYYKSIARKNVFSWLDVANEPHFLDEFNISQADALRRLHVIDVSGRIHIGVAAFAIIWQKLAYWRYLAVIVKLPVILPLTNAAYNMFAYYRFSRLPHCKLAIKQLK